MVQKKLILIVGIIAIIVIVSGVGIYSFLNTIGLNHNIEFSYLWGLILTPSIFSFFMISRLYINRDTV